MTYDRLLGDIYNNLKKNYLIITDCYFTNPNFLASTSYINNLHIFTTKTSASSSNT